MDDALMNLLAESNPVSRDTSSGLDPEILYAATRRRIQATVPDPRLRLRLRRSDVAIAIATAVLLAPALALSGTLGDLFGFSSSGTAPTVPIAPDSLSILSRVGSTPDVVRLLATRDGKAFYAARSASGQLCVGVADAAVAALSFEQLQCTRGGDAFPSPTVPVLQTSPVYGREGSNDVFVQQLAGFAADGVAKVQVTGPSGVVASADVSDNVFAVPVPNQPVTSIEALAQDGTKIWSGPLVHAP